MKSVLIDHCKLGFFGLAMGVILHRIGFSDYGELHKLFIFSDLRLLYTFAGAVIFAAIGFIILTKGKFFSQRPFHKGIIPGGILFGIGWALCGACPSIVFVQLGEGKIAALATMAGIFFGVWLFAKLKPKFFRWSTGACDF